LKSLKPGDEVLQIARNINDLDIANGDTGPELPRQGRSHHLPRRAAPLECGKPYCSTHSRNVAFRFNNKYYT
jgi:hypothetical protein